MQKNYKNNHPELKENHRRAKEVTEKHKKEGIGASYEGHISKWE